MPSGLPTARLLKAADLPDLCEIDSKLMRAHLSSLPSSKTAVALIPDVQTMDWHHSREDFVGEELHGRTPEIKGALVGSEEGKRVWCYWTRMWYNNDPTESKDNTLHILRLVIEDGDVSEELVTHDTNSINGAMNGHSNGLVENINKKGEHHVRAIETLLRVAQAQAKEWKMEHVELWNPSAVGIEAARRIQSDAAVVDRDKESIASFLWYGDEPKSDTGKVADLVDWIGNEKYGWC
jgi:hypothetical protein